MLEDDIRNRAALWGGSKTYQAHLTTARKLSDRQLLELVDEVRKVTQHQGDVKEVMNSLEWETVGKVDQIAVSIRAKEDDTTVQIIGDRNAAAALVWVTSIAGGLAAGGIVGAIVEPATVLGGVGIMAACGTLGVGVARGLWAYTTRGFRRRFMELRQRVSTYLGE